MNKIGIVLGTRPEIIKMCPVIKELQKRRINYFVIHTGQHYSFELDKVFFDNLNLDKPKYNLEVGSGGHGETTGKMLIEIENILKKEKPNSVLVQGDTNSVLAGALAASKLGIKVGHIEAGLRSYDREMPEEINRVLVDHLADFLFVPTLEAKKNALKENIKEERLFVVGNTVVDAVFQNLKLSKDKRMILKDLNLEKDNYSLLTLHRPSNVDNKESLIRIFKAINQLNKLGINKILFPIHPRTEKNIEKFNLELPKNLIKMTPVGYLEMLQFMNNAKIIFTDSGGIQEEACILKIPCVTLRHNTERPETLSVGANVLVGDDINKIIKGTEKMINKISNWENPFGKGDTSVQIIDILEKL